MFTNRGGLLGRGQSDVSSRLAAEHHEREKQTNCTCVCLCV